jgi:hypothetical protein
VTLSGVLVVDDFGELKRTESRGDALAREVGRSEGWGRRGAIGMPDGSTSTQTTVSSPPLNTFLLPLTVRNESWPRFWVCPQKTTRGSLAAIVSRRSIDPSLFGRIAAADQCGVFCYIYLSVIPRQFQSPSSGCDLLTVSLWIETTQEHVEE